MISSNALHTPHQPPVATSKELHDILGPIDPEMVVDILRTGATADEVSQAFAWLCDGDYMGAELHKPMTDKIRRVLDLLEAERDAISPEGP